MTITHHAHIYSFHTSNFIFGQIIFLKFLSIPPLLLSLIKAQENLWAIYGRIAVKLLRLFCTIFYIQWACDIMSPSTTTQTNNKHHHHGDGAACPSSGMGLWIHAAQVVGGLAHTLFEAAVKAI
jgi:hypothetical protein